MSGIGADLLEDCNVIVTLLLHQATQLCVWSFVCGPLLFHQVTLHYCIDVVSIVVSAWMLSLFVTVMSFVWSALRLFI